MWLCDCDCGGTSIVQGTYLRNGNTASCGCAKLEASHRNGLLQKHGHTANSEFSYTYKAWSSMLRRVDHKPSYSGISVCERWHTFTNFLEDMGERPKGTTIDRFPNQSGNYEPGNCRWATPKQQARNRGNNLLITFQGKTLCPSEWSEITGIGRNTIRERIQRGWSAEAALTTPVRARRIAH
jgi:hypothetical protein